MLKRIADKAGKEMVATDQDGSVVRFKLLNTAYLGIRKLHTDQQGVAAVDSGIEAGTILTLPSGERLIVSMLTTDFYRGEAIRFALDLVEANNEVTVTRNTPQLSPQGGILGQSEVQVYANVPVKIGTVFQVRDADNDATVSQFGMLLSTKYPVKQGDSLSFKSHYEDAKVEGVKLNYEGIYEVAFDRDPRWT